jgi:hypothetical protein
MQRARSSLWVVLCMGAATACGGASGKEPAVAGAPSDGAGGPLAGSAVFDVAGQSHTCAAPKQDCPDAEQAPRELKDQCALKGYRIVQCGCEQFCTGNAMAEQLHYDASNTGKLCDKAKDSCEPAETSAAFQDACTAARGKFVVCGCEWRCTQKLKGPVADKPPPEEEPAEEPAPEPKKQPGSPAKKK